MHATTDKMTRLLTEEWNALHAHEKREALDLARRWAQQDAAQLAETPTSGWTNRFADLIAMRIGDGAAHAWETVSCASSLPLDGLDPRETMFSAVATETRLRHRPRSARAAARVMLRRAGNRTANVRARRTLTPTAA